ncbi:ABC transporter substrate-binding protein [Bordetella petrii]|nr:ABC transporter substrate-binding protein [Bordetella petrii]
MFGHPKLTKAGLAIVASLFAAGSALAADTIKIGMTSALTGPYNEFGEGNRRAVELAIEQWNAKGGINGKKIELAMLLDDQLNPDRAVQNMRSILDNKEIVGVIGPAGSGPTLAVIDMVQADGRPYMNPIAQTPVVTYPGEKTGENPRPNVFSFALQNDVEAVAMGQYLARHFKRIGIVHESTAYGVTGTDYLSASIEKNGGAKPVATDSYNQGAQDMTAQVARMKRGNVDAIAAIGLGKDLAVLRRTMARLNLNVPLVASNGALGQPYQEGAGDLTLGTLGTMIGAFGQPMRPEAAAFAQAYKQKYGVDRWWGNDAENPQLFMAISVSNGYDAANILFEGIRRAGSNDPKAINAAIESIKDYPGVNTIYSFSKDRHHGIETDGVKVFEYVKQDDKVRLKPITE